VHLTDSVEYKVFNVQASPPRVAVDLEDTRLHGSIALPEDYQGTLIHGVRFGQHDKTTGRLVFDLAADTEPSNVQLVESEEADGGYWLQFDLSTESSGRNTYEKDLTLRYALALQQALQKTGRYRVALTRRDDHYLLLRERVKRAREAHGDLFISLHADSAPTRSARGLSVYTISEKASDKESEALASQENHADVIGGVDLSDASDDVAGILIDLAERETREKSAEFADLAIKHLGREVGLLSNTHRFAGFAVLKAPDIPSVLVEIGFLTNPKEESQLRSRSYQTKVVRGLAQAVDEYFGKKK
jgi:N-acetylmuramoyl-L-alanine amidase